MQNAYNEPVGPFFQLLCGRSIWFCSNSKSNSLLPFCLFVEFDRNWVLFNLNLETCNQKFFYLRFHRICLFRLFSNLFKLLGKWACQTAWPMYYASPRLTRGALTSFYLFSADFFRLVQIIFLKRLLETCFITTKILQCKLFQSLFLLLRKRKG